MGSSKKEPPVEELLKQQMAKEEYYDDGYSGYDDGGSSGGNRRGGGGGNGDFSGQSGDEGSSWISDDILQATFATIGFVCVVRVLNILSLSLSFSCTHTVVKNNKQ